MNAKPLVSRLDVESYAQLMLAAHHGGRFLRGHGEGASDAALGRVFGARRGTFTNKDEYRLGYAFGRFMLFAGLPRWREPANPETATKWFARFAASPEGKGVGA